MPMRTIATIRITISNLKRPRRFYLLVFLLELIMKTESIATPAPTKTTSMTELGTAGEIEGDVGELFGVGPGEGRSLLTVL
jgi:hypothetical protein